MPKASFTKGKIHYVGISEELFNKVQNEATKDRLFVTQFVHKALIEKIDGETKTTVPNDDF